MPQAVPSCGEMSHPVHGVGGLIQPLSDLLLTAPSLPDDGNWLAMLSVLSPCTLVY